jgi:tRNA uridine 5-carbamoylmethylation protein Kti12
MALITFSGFPSSGKTARAQQLKLFLDARLADPAYDGHVRTVTVLSDDGVNVLRSSYDGANPHLFSGCFPFLIHDILILSCISCTS